MIRPATPNDAEACVDILRAWIKEIAWMPMLHSRSSMLAYWGARLREAEGVVVAEDGGVLGFAVREGGYVSALYVAANARRRGAGTALLEAVARGRDTHLWTFQANAVARAFYAAKGFREIRRTDGENEEELSDVLLYRAGSA
ncbi:MAG: GNAT family N-acetyltransferase [Pseudomonadota bacterium]